MADEARRPRVLLLNEFFYPDNQGGTATATANIASRLHKVHGFDVDVITGHTAYRDSSVQYGPFEDWDGIQIHRVSSPNWIRKRTIQRLAGNLLFALAVARKAKSLPKPDAVVVTTAPVTLPIAASMIRKRTGAPYAYVIYDLDPDRTVALHLMEEGAKPVQILRKHQTKWLASAGKVIAIGRCMKEHLHKAYGIPNDKIDVSEVGADPEVVRPMPKLDTAFRARHGITGFVALYSGNFGQYHDFDTLLDAAAKLKDKPVTFVLVGGGHKKQAVADAVVQRSLDNVKVMDFVPESELADMMASADLQIVTLEPGMEGLCVPSKFYTCLASGRPTLALMTAGPEVSRVIAETGCGMRADIGDPDAVAQGILEMLDQPAKLDAMGVTAREVFEHEYTIDATVGKLAASLRSMIR